jgi:hypothetical protein
MKMKFKIFLLIIVFIFFNTTLNPQNSRETGFQLLIDGPDPDNEYTITEAINFGKIDPWGSMSIGGNFSGLMGRPLGASSFDDVNCKGAIYEFSPQTGGNSEFYHPNSTIAIKIHSSTRWQLSVSAQIIGDPSIEVGQLWFKEDSETEYTPFTNNPQIIANGQPGTFYLYYDLALMIEFDDKPGNYSWQITFLLSSI